MSIEAKVELRWIMCFQSSACVPMWCMECSIHVIYNLCWQFGKKKWPNVGLRMLQVCK